MVGIRLDCNQVNITACKLYFSYTIPILERLYNHALHRAQRNVPEANNTRYRLLDPHSNSHRFTEEFRCYRKLPKPLSHQLTSLNECYCLLSPQFQMYAAVLATLLVSAFGYAITKMCQARMLIIERQRMGMVGETPWTTFDEIFTDHMYSLSRLNTVCFSAISSSSSQ